jgi:hypothetical protein
METEHPQLTEEGHEQCSNCLTRFPRSWLSGGQYGAKRVGFKYFCSSGKNGCEEKYFKQRPIVGEYRKAA